MFKIFCLHLGLKTLKNKTKSIFILRFTKVNRDLIIAQITFKEK